MESSKYIVSEDAVITLRSKDGYQCEVDLDLAKEIPFVSYALQESTSAYDQFLVLGEISGRILRKIIDYCRFHFDFKQRWYKAYGDSLDLTTLNEEEELWDNEFLCLDGQTLVELLVAADFLNFNELKDKIISKLGKWMPIVGDSMI